MKWERSIRKIGGSYYVPLPVNVVEGMEWEEKTEVVITTEEERICISAKKESSKK